MSTLTWSTAVVFPLLLLYLYNDHDIQEGTTNSNSTGSSSSIIINQTNTAGRIIDYLPSSILYLEVSSSLYWLALVCVLVYTLYLFHNIYQAVFGCPDYVYRPSDRDVGYLVTPGKTKRDIVNMVRQRRKVGDIPPPYPNGWYEVMRSCDLPIGTSRAVHMNGEHLAVFRNERGHVSVTDAYCPHLGANLGVGGRVIGNCIECPFHGWQFDGETGQCTAVPYSTGKVPTFVKIKVWPSMEVNGLIMFWYDAEGRDPYYTIPEVPEIKSGRWVYRGRTVQYMNCHIEEVNENGADMSHLNVVHEAGLSAGYGINYRLNSWLGSLMTQVWSGNWEPLPSPNEHIGHMDLKTSIKLFGHWPIRLLDVTVSIDQIGPGVVQLKASSPLWTGIYYQTLVPEGPLQQRLTTSFYCDWWLPGLMGRAILRTYSIQVERDALIWDNKMYLKKPGLVKEDHLIQAHRRWFGQFYTQNSVKMPTTSSGQKTIDLSW